ncbi:hypothetical protein JCM11641_003765 [Rhodosporidiobolus odoratus]
MAHTATSLWRPSDEGDELPFGDFCFTCGNATQGQSYCSDDCRQADIDRSEPSPDFSPSLSAVPPLVSSARSACSTPPSSAQNSPSPISDAMGHLAEPPSLDLPPPKPRFEYGAQSLPTAGLPLPANWTINYQADSLASPLVTPSDALVSKDVSFQYRRRMNRPQAAVPSPLYFRQKAAAVHSSPAFGPISPSARMVSFSSATDFSGAHVLEDEITALSLAGHEDPAAPAPIVPTPAHCGRPGCVGAPVGAPVRPKINTSVAGLAGQNGRRQSWQANGGVAPAALTPTEATDEVLLSPRIRALRTGRESPEQGILVKQAAKDEDDAHSAFACYLFSHLTSKPAPPERGRSASIEHVAAELQRSLSVDAALATRAPTASSAVSNSSKPSPARPVRPIRGMLGGRGPAPAAAIRSEPAIQPLTSIGADLTEEPQSSRIHDRDATIRPPVERRGRSERMKLTPGHFIEATCASSSTFTSPSSFLSPPPSPPTAGRGRSSARRLSDAVGVDATVESFVPRGRSQLRGTGALQRALSPSTHDTSLSRERTRSRSRSRTQTRQSSRSSCDRGKAGARGCSPRGRTRGGIVSEDAEEDDGQDERGRGRTRDSRSRSRSLLRRGRGREVIISQGAYGHLDSSDESDRGR